MFSKPVVLAAAVVVLVVVPELSADTFTRRATFDPAAGPNEYTLSFPVELGGSEIPMPITGGSFLIETDGSEGTCRLIEWRQDVASIQLFGATTGPITISLDAAAPSAGTYTPESGAFSVTGTFLIEFDDTELAELGFVSPVVLEGTEAGTINGVGKLGTVSMFLEGEGSFSAGTFSYTCSTTAHIDYDLPDGEGQSADVNHDQEIDLADAIRILQGLFGGETVECPLGGEVNGDGAVDVADAVFLLSYLFGDGPRPIEAIVTCP